MDSKEVRATLTKPQIARLKQMTAGLRVGRVLGERVLVKLAIPYTEMDRLEKEGLVVIPETARDANTPMPTTGVVVATGEAVGELHEGDMIMFSKYAGTDAIFNEEEFRILEEREVLCTLVTDEPLAPVAPIAN